MILTRQAIHSPRRSLVKTLTWRTFAEIDTFLISFILTGSLAMSLSIIGVEATTKTVLYYLHERLWSHVKWGFVDNNSPS